MERGDCVATPSANSEDAPDELMIPSFASKETNSMPFAHKAGYAEMSSSDDDSDGTIVDGSSLIPALGIVTPHNAGIEDGEDSQPAGLSSALGDGRGASDGGKYARRSSNLFAARGRFRRQRTSEAEESDADKKAMFWAGVKPTRANSSPFLAVRKSGGPGSLSMATVRAAIKLKKRANDIHAKSILSAYIYDPRSRRMTMWKNWMLVNIMYTVLVVPWRISFHSDAGILGLMLSGIVNVSFVVDTVLHFFTAVPTEAGLIIDRKLIIRRYLSTWFLLDLVTCLPVTTLLRGTVSASMRVIAPLRGVRLLSLLKVVKVYAMHYEVRFR